MNSPTIPKYSLKLVSFWLWFLVSLFNSIWTFEGLFNAKAIFVKEQHWYYWTQDWGNKGIYTFLKGPKVNVIVWLEFEIMYFEARGQHFIYYAMGTTQPVSLESLNGAFGSIQDYRFELNIYLKIITNMKSESYWEKFHKRFHRHFLEIKLLLAF